MTTWAKPLIDHWMTLHSLIVMLGLAVYVITSHTLQQRRHPSAAIAWVVAIVLLPYIAVPLFLMFGSRKLKGDRASENGREFMPCGADPSAPAARTRQLAAVMALPAASAYRQLNIHEDGAQALQALRSTLEGAARTVDLCTFLFARDALGGEIAEILKRRARDGLRVRLMVDGVGAWLDARTDYKSLVAAGVELALFVPPFRSSLRGRINLRNHRKMVIADSERLWCGGRNLAAEYFEGDANSSRRNQPWIDLSFDVHGDLALQAQWQFEQDWNFATGRELAPASPPDHDPAPGSALAQLIASGPDQADDTLYTLLVSGFFIARKRITAVTPYFVPNPTLLMSLTLAARRGVSVDLIVPGKSNHRLADLARHRALRELTAAGARVWLLPRMIHAKAIVIDDEIAFVGSANLDERSLFLNYELMVSFYEPADVLRFAEWIDHQRCSAEPYVARPPGLLREISEGLLLWLAFQL